MGWACLRDMPLDSGSQHAGFTGLSATAGRMHQGLATRHAAHLALTPTLRSMMSHQVFLMQA